MKYLREFVMSTLVGGLAHRGAGLPCGTAAAQGHEVGRRPERPIAVLLPDWLPAEGLIGLLLVLAVCFLVGVAVRTRTGRVVREKMEVAFFGRLPGYGLINGLTQRLAETLRGPSGRRRWSKSRTRSSRGSSSKCSTTAESLSSFRRCPHLSAGAVYIPGPERVHIVDVPFTEAIRSVSRWGSGSKDLVAAMRKG